MLLYYLMYALNRNNRSSFTSEEAVSIFYLFNVFILASAVGVHLYRLEAQTTWKLQANGEIRVSVFLCLFCEE